MKIHLLHPATFKLDGGAMFGIIPKPLWEKKIAPDEHNRILMSLRVPFIETENRKILIDTGIGDYHGSKFDEQFDISDSNSPLTTVLAELAVTPADITDIILTHLHFDHVGGLGTFKDQRPQLLFPNATVHVHQKHFEYSQNPTPRDKGSFQSHYFNDWLEIYRSRGKFNLLEELKGEIVPGVSYMTSFGHTPYMIHPIFDQYIYMADLTPMSHHVHIPWVMGYDIEPGVTVQYKEKFYQEIIERDLTMIFEHDVDIFGGKLAQNDKGHFYLNHTLTKKDFGVQKSSRAVKF